MDKSNSFEENLNRLEKIVSDLEKNELNLDDALKVFEESHDLIKKCENELKSAEQKVKKLIKNDDDSSDKFQLELM